MAIVSRARMTDGRPRAATSRPYDSWNRTASRRWAFVQDIPMSPRSHPSLRRRSSEVEEGLSRSSRDSPVNALVWGERDWCFTPDFRREFEARFPHAAVLKLDDAGHYALEDAHERILPWLNEQLRRASDA